MSEIQAWIENEVKTNDVLLFMKGTPTFPQCGFSSQVVQILDYLGLDYKGINVLENAEIRQGIKDYSNWPTIPQLYVKGEFVGGCDIVREMFQAGELAPLLTEKGITVGATPAEKPPRCRQTKRPPAGGAFCSRSRPPVGGKEFKDQKRVHLHGA